MRAAQQTMYEAESLAFDMSGILTIQVGGGTQEIQVTYAGDSRVDYNSASLTLTTPAETVETGVIGVENTSYVFDESAQRWDEVEGLPIFMALTNPSVLFDIQGYFGGDPPDTLGTQISHLAFWFREWSGGRGLVRGAIAGEARESRANDPTGAGFGEPACSRQVAAAFRRCSRWL